MTKNSLILIGALILFSSYARAEEATIATESTPLKISGSVGAKSIATLPGGTKVNKVGQKGMWTQVEVTDESGNVQKGYVSAAAITTGPSVLGKLGKGKRIATGSVKEALGAAGKGKSEASANAMDGMLDAASGDTAAGDDLLGADQADLDAASPADSAPKAVSNKSLDHLDTIKIGDAEIMSFMKAGGLKSRLLK